MELKFTVRQGRKDTDMVEVKYDCACGCHPVAIYVREDTKAGSQHCCCGIVHFVGPDAEAQLRKYMDDRKAQGLDGSITKHEFRQTAVTAHWGAEIEVAYAVPTYR